MEADGTKYHMGSFVNGAGEARVKFVECDGAIHWPTPSMATYAIDFLEQWTVADAAAADVANLADFRGAFSL